MLLSWKKRKGLVRFVQAPGGGTHSFKIEYCHSFLRTLHESVASFPITCVELLLTKRNVQISCWQNLLGWAF
jgi:hypothetical protein